MRQWFSVNIFCWFCFCTFYVLIVTGCGSNTTETIVDPNFDVNITQKYNFNNISTLRTFSITLPQNLNVTQVGTPEYSCQQVGHDIRPYAGQTLSVTEYLIPQNPGIQSGLLLSRLTFSNLEHADICSYLLYIAPAGH